MYSTISAIRTEAGFDTNPDITNGLIQSYQVKANAIVVSFVSGIYTLTDLQASEYFTSSQAESYLATAECLIAAGMLIDKEFGEQIYAGDEGKKKIQSGKEMLLMMTDKKTPVRLIDAQGNEFTRRIIALGGAMIMTGGVRESKFTVDDDR